MLPPASSRWRWEQAVKAAALPDTQAQYQLRVADPATREAYRLKRAMDRQFYYDGPYRDAYEIAEIRHDVRLHVQCMLLAGASDKETAAYASITGPGALETVSAYHDLFFDVRPYLTADDDVEGNGDAHIMAMLFGNESFRPLVRTDKEAILHRIAWMGGALLFKACVKIRRSEAFEAEIERNLTTIIQRMLKRQCLMIAQTLGHGGELGIEAMRLAFEATAETIEKALPAHQQALAALHTGVKAFLESVPLTVADPTKSASILGKGGSEPRAMALLSV